MYNTDNIFYKIINKLIISNFIYKDKYIIAINDINPEDNTHILIIPVDNIIDLNEMLESKNYLNYIKSIRKCIIFLRNKGLKSYKFITNIGTYQEIKHIHFHIISKDILV